MCKISYGQYTLREEIFAEFNFAGDRNFQTKFLPILTHSHPS